MNPIIINFYLAVFGMITTLVTIRGIRTISKLLGFDCRYMRFIMDCTLIYMLSVMIDSYISGKPGAVVHIVMRLSNTLEYVSLYLICLSMTCYILYLIRKNGRPNLPLHRILHYYLTPFIMLFISCFSDLYFYIGDDNCYHVGKYFFISQILGALAMICNVILLIGFRWVFRREEWLLFKFMVVISMLAVCLQFGRSIKFMVIASSFSCLAMLIALLDRSRVEYSEKLLELEQVRSNMTYTQLNPHFLYNSLSAISVLCKKDPEKGSAMADQVSEFLRKSSEDMRSLNFHPFADELEHTRNYLEIEQIRYGEDLQVDYDIQDQDFKLPGFVLQQLAELLIRYEFIRMDDIIYISIRSALIQNKHIVHITSNGNGPAEKVQNCSRTEWASVLDPTDPQYPEIVDLEKIRTRLSAIPEATLKAETYYMKGTVFTITIPVKE